ncbi:CHAT domain-containing protein [Glycomyces salinus]|uniref:CHAT domain-containing protein n=1 Tax=Glycomyces salinus TaxID=980294 RepID=UPI0018EC67F1|nr:CHAT domain-containing protein [Glycomyces salinus]
MVSESALIQQLSDHIRDLDVTDPEQVLDDRLLALAEELRGRRVTDLDEALWGCMAIALLHFCRAGMLEGEQRHRETVRAAGLYSIIGQLRPDLVPAELRHLIVDPDSPNPTLGRLDAVRDNALESGDPAALNLAAAVLRVRLEPEPDDPDRLADLAEVLWARAQRVHDIGDLDEAAHVNRAWTAATPADHPDSAFRLWRLGLAHFGRHAVLGERADLDAAVTHYFNAYKSAADDDPNRRSYIVDLSLGLHRRADLTGRVEDLDLAVDSWRLVLAMTPGENADNAAHQFNLGTMLSGRFRATGDPADLDAAIEAWQEAAAHFGPGHHIHTTAVPPLAELLQTRAERDGTPADAAEAAALMRALIESGDTGPDPAQARAILGAVLWTVYGLTGDLDDLEHGVEAARSALDLTPEDHPLRRARQSTLSNTLVTRYRRLSESGDLQEAVELAGSSVSSIPPGFPDSGVILSNAGNALREMAERTGDTDGLAAAAQLLRRSIEALAPSDFRRAAVLSNLASTLHHWAERTGELDRADDAVTVAREALGAASGGGPHRAGNLANLAAALGTRYRITGGVADRDEAAELVRESLRLTPADHPGRPTRLASLAVVELERFEHYGGEEKLAEALDLGAEALDLTPATHRLRATLASYLAKAHLLSFRASDNPADLERAVAHARDATAATPADDSSHAAALSNLAEMLHRRFEALADPDDLEQALSLAARALEHAPVDSPGRAHMHWVLGKALDSKAEDPAARAEAAAAFGDAAAVASAPVSLRVRAGHIAARMIMSEGDGDAAAALPLLRSAVELLPRLAWRGLDSGDRRRLLDEDAAALAMDAAACAIGVGDVASAVSVLEQGRGVLWGQLLDLRSDRARLREAHPGLAAELDRCLAVLDPAGADHEADTEREGQARHEAARRLDALTEEIRALPATPQFPNPTEFMSPPAFDDLLPTGPGAVVVLNVSRWRCDAIVLTRQIQTSVPLPFTAEEAVEATNQYLRALRRYTGPDGRLGLEAATRATLEWLWDRVAAPVLEHLGFGPEPAEPPRVWWCPTGPLTLLPVHAAGSGERGESVLDRAVSSYTPTLRALAHTRSRDRGADPDPLVVSVAETPGPFAALPGAAREQRMLTELFGADAVTTLTDEAATREAIAAGLGSHSWVHIASHGTQDLDRPSEGGLVPFDWQTAGLVRVDDLAGIAGTGGLAFLSACQTATGGVANLDEAISVAAAMQHTGWSHVVGTLWTVNDNAASEVAERFYRRLVRDGRADASAHALHDAVLAVREAHPDDTAHWARFVHFGP